MKTITLTVNEAQAKALQELEAYRGKSLQEILVDKLLEEAEDARDAREAEEALREWDGETVSLEEAIEDWKKRGDGLED